MIKPAWIRRGREALLSFALIAAAHASPALQGKADRLTTIDDDLQFVVGGHFTPDSLGPEKYAAVRNRVNSQPDAFVNAFEAAYLGSHFDVHAHARLYLPSFLLLVRDARPERARRAAEQLLKLYEAVLFVSDRATDEAALLKLLPKESGQELQALALRRNQLRAVLAGTSP